MPIERFRLASGSKWRRSPRLPFGEPPEDISPHSLCASEPRRVSKVCRDRSPCPTSSEANISPEVSFPVIFCGVVCTSRSARGGAIVSSPIVKCMESTAAMKLCVSFRSERNSPSRRRRQAIGEVANPRRCRSRSMRSIPTPILIPLGERMPSSWSERLAPGFSLLRESARYPPSRFASSVTSRSCRLPQ